jgi:large subunit ribosomal protein L19
MKAKGSTKETITYLDMEKRNFPDFQVGDCIAVSQRIREGEKERLQVFEGDVIAMHHNGMATTFTVRKMAANNVAVERIIPLYSPLISGINIVRKGDVRRAKLYYVRGRVGRAAQIKEHVLTREEKELQKAAAKKTE